MTTAYWCVFIAAILPYVWTITAKVTIKHFDNSQPRIALAALEGWPQRANWAQMNSFESFPPFAAAVIIATLIGKIDPSMLNNLAVLFVICRVLHGLSYLANQAIIRSSAWLVSICAWVTIFILSV